MVYLLNLLLSISHGQDNWKSQGSVHERVSTCQVESRPYFWHEQAPVLGTCSFLIISSKKYLKHHNEAFWYQSDNWRELQVTLDLKVIWGFRGIIFLLYWPRQQAKAAPRCGDSPPHLPLYPPPPLELRRRIEQPLQSRTGRGNRILNSNFKFRSIVTLIPNGLIVVLEIFFAGNNKKTVNP